MGTTRSPAKLSMHDTTAFTPAPRAWALLAAVLATAVQAEIGVAPHLPHSETLARGELLSGSLESLQRDGDHACGGVGERSQAAMRALAPRYDLALTFATRSGHYLADVEVEVVDRRGGRVLRLTCDGPMLLLQLPRAGRYTVIARSGGREVRQLVRVPSGGRTSAVLRWPDGR